MLPALNSVNQVTPRWLSMDKLVGSATEACAGSVYSLYTPPPALVKTDSLSARLSVKSTLPGVVESIVRSVGPYWSPGMTLSKFRFQIVSAPFDACNLPTELLLASVNQTYRSVTLWNGPVKTA